MLCLCEKSRQIVGYAACKQFYLLHKTDLLRLVDNNDHQQPGFSLGIRGILSVF